MSARLKRAIVILLVPSKVFCISGCLLHLVAGLTIGLLPALTPVRIVLLIAVATSFVNFFLIWRRAGKVSQIRIANDRCSLYKGGVEQVFSAQVDGATTPYFAVLKFYPESFDSNNGKPLLLPVFRDSMRGSDWRILSSFLRCLPQKQPQA